MNAIFKLFTLAAFFFLLSAGREMKAQVAVQKMQVPAVGTETEYQKNLRLMAIHLDSLFLERKYGELIQFGELTALGEGDAMSAKANPYLISAYYFSGNVKRSNKLLNEKLRKLDYKGIIDLLTTDNIALARFFDVAANRDPVIELAVERYKKEEKGTQKAEGEQIIRFFITDQRILKLKPAYVKETVELQAGITRKVEELDSIKNLQLYAFYKKQGKYFNAKEVAEYVSWLQPIILCHYYDIEQRQTFFKALLEKGVAEGRCQKITMVNFILRTESFIDPDFFKYLPQRTEEARREYDLPDYNYSAF